RGRQRLLGGMRAWSAGPRDRPRSRQGDFSSGSLGGPRRAEAQPLPRRLGVAVRPRAARTRAVVYRRQHGPVLERRAAVRARADLAGSGGPEERAPFGAAGAPRGLPVPRLPDLSRAGGRVS